MDKIECTLMKLENYSAALGIPMANVDKKAKYGLYSNSYFHGIRGFGKKCWVVIVNIDVDYDKYISQGLSLEQVVEGCIGHLNSPPKSKYGKRRKRKPSYGVFRDKPYQFRTKEKNGVKYIQAHLVVENRKRKHFRGQGIQT